MAFPLPYSVPADYTRLDYSQATPAQLAHLLLAIRDNFQEYFPDLSPASWIIALARIRPTLLTSPDALTITWEDSKRVAQVLASIPPTPGLEATGYCTQAVYLARCAAKDAALAQLALAELEANPLLCGPYCYELIAQLAAGNSVAQEILQVTEWLARDPHSSDEDHLSLNPAFKSDKPDLGKRLYAVEQARAHSCPAASTPADSASPTT